MVVCYTSTHVILRWSRLVDEMSDSFRARKPSRYMQPSIISTKPEPKRMFVCIFFLLSVYVTMCFPPGPTQYNILYAWGEYSLFVLKLPLNTDRPINRRPTDQIWQVIGKGRVSSALATPKTNQQGRALQNCLRPYACSYHIRPTATNFVMVIRLEKRQFLWSIMPATPRSQDTSDPNFWTRLNTHSHTPTWPDTEQPNFAPLVGDKINFQGPPHLPR